MSQYNRVESPKVFVDNLAFSLASGWRDLDDFTIVKTSDGTTVPTLTTGVKANLFDLKPHDPVGFIHTTKQFTIVYDTGLGTDNYAESNFLAILGHNFHDADCVFKVEISDSSNFSSGVTTVSTTGNHTKVINATADSSSDYIDPANNGWTLITWANQTSGNRYLRITLEDDGGSASNFNEALFIGSLMYGESISLGNASMNVQTSVIYDGTTLSQSTGGATFANTKYFGQPVWSGATTLPWNTVTTTDQHTYGFKQRYGRLKHNLNFEYLTDTNLWSKNMHGHSDPTDWEDSETLHSNFFQKTMGQHLPFLMSINGESTSEGDYSMYRIGQNGFSATQVAHRLWSYNLELIESW